MRNSFIAADALGAARPVPPFPTEIALQLIEEDLGQPASAIMSIITPEPVAAASLGQVHITEPHSLNASVRLPRWLSL